jgi:ribosomal protein RSM22 (predicted rRNA methylase)
VKSLLGVGHQCNNSWKPPARVLDFGVGCGSASAAALHVFPDSVEWVHGIDPSQTMREGAKYFLDELFKQQQQQNDKGTGDGGVGKSSNVPRTTFSAHISAESAPGTFDLVMLAYTATELPHNAATLAAAAVCWEKLRPGGLFVMIEPGTPDGFSSVRTVRNMLLDCFSSSSTDGDSTETCHMIAPCTHNGRCPMERFQQKVEVKKTQRNVDDEGDKSDEEPDDEASDGEDDEENEEDGTRKGYCSFVQGMPGGTGGGKGEKFSYIVAQKRVASDSDAELSHRFDDVNLPDLLKRTRLSAMGMQGHDHAPDAALLKEAVDLETRFLASDDDELGLELLRGDANRQSYGRIIRAPKKKKGHVLIDCCVAPGNIVRNKVSKSMSKPIPGIYSASRKSRWGGLWPAVAELQE